MTLTTLYRRLAERFWGKDVFISYSRADGAAYALALAARLSERNFACVIDQWGMSTPGVAIPALLRENLRGCRAMVLLATQAAGASPYVREEVETFVATPGMLIPIDLDGSIRDAQWWPLIEGLPIAVERAAAITAPSDAVLDRIANTLTFRRRDQRMRRVALATGAAIAAMLAGLGGLVWISAGLVSANEAALKSAADATGLATAADRRREGADRQLQTTKGELARQQIALGKAREETRQSQRIAQSAAQMARLAINRANLARAATRVAEAQRRNAQTAELAARAEAERQLTIADSRQLASLSNQSDTAPESALFAAQALDRAWTIQATQSAMAALARLPRLVRRFSLDGAVDALALSHDGTHLAVAGRRGEPGIEGGLFTLALWDLTAGTPLWSTNRSDEVAFLRFSAEGTRLIDATCDGRVTVSDSMAGARIAQFSHGSSCPHALDVSANDRVAVADPRSTAVYELASGAQLASRPNGKRYVRYDQGLAGNAATAETADEVRNAEASAIVIDRAGAQTFSLVGTELVNTRLADGRIRTVSFPEEGASLALSPDGSTLAVALAWSQGFEGDVDGDEEPDHYRERVFVLDTETLARLAELPQPAATSMAFSPDGKMLTIGLPGHLTLWDWRAVRKLREFEGSGESVAFSAKGEHVLASGDGGAAVFDVETGMATADTSESTGRFGVFSADGGVLATAQNLEDHAVIRVRSPKSMAEAASMGWEGDTPETLVFSPDGQRLAITTYYYNRVLLWDLSSGTQQELVFDERGAHLLDRNSSSTRLSGIEDDTPIFAESTVKVAFSKDGRLLHIARTDEPIVTLDIALGGLAPHETTDAGSDTTVPFDRDRSGMVAAPGESGQFADARVAESDDVTVTHLTLDPSGQKIASIGDNNELKLFDAASRSLRFTLDLDASGDMAFDPTGHWLAVTDSDGIRIVDTERGEFVGQFDGRGLVAFDPGGRYLALASSGERNSSGLVQLLHWRPSDLVDELCRRIDGTVRSDESDRAPASASGGAPRIEPKGACE